MTKPVALPPFDVPSSPNFEVPPLACDSHLHMVADDFPLSLTRVEDPAPGTFEKWVERLERHHKQMGLSRRIIVHSILYGADNALTLASIDALGRDVTRGIGLVPDDAPATDLDPLVAGGVVGVRLNYVHGGVLSWSGVQALAPALAKRGMHVQMLVHTHQHMVELADHIRDLPVPVCFDHMGWPDLSLGPGEPGFQALCQLLAEGLAWVKLSAPYRLCDAPYKAAAPFARALLAANPERCLWGSDWPHLMLADAGLPDAGVLLNLLPDWAPDAATRMRILVDNPAQLYGFGA
ncbi:amidohydrolase [Actibacterium sp. 188UL27-1]|uniref:amidohydrolase family protein n=1 Tax=Actibacterium sp. 188UL27-1 TaxID=2786961 RepID=UPI00195E72D9|nr:amidohydrolase family protein [Actibacterium sp. 188UL27-1]MBM7066170.1 amidohydrolase family protein [Actibacterium sp. 188UL27-1]